MINSFITGVAGAILSPDEGAFLRQAQPAGLILFKRNCIDPEQLRRLIGSFHDAVGSSDPLVLVDQEGGRVQRLKPPHWRLLPASSAYGMLYAKDPAQAVTSARLAARLLATELRAIGITMNCTPVLDLPLPNAHAIIGDRAYASDVSTVIALGRAVAQGHLDAGVVPVIKHIPGHGRAMQDSHLALPVVDTPAQTLVDTDFAPFRALAELPVAMTAHVVFSAYDQEQPASCSAHVTAHVIREHIGFDGLLISDDLSMRALSGTIAERTGAVLAAGSDLALHCNGELDEMMQVAQVASPLAGRALQRYQTALGCLDATPETDSFDIAEAEARLKEALSVST